MSDIIISSVKTRKELRQFAKFNYELYKDNPYAVPHLLEDTVDTFDPEKNPAFRSGNHQSSCQRDMEYQACAFWLDRFYRRHRGDPCADGDC